MQKREARERGVGSEELGISTQRKEQREKGK
jgi:hypothetical protein